jgi:hypothetical protein
VSDDNRTVTKDAGGDSVSIYPAISTEGPQIDIEPRDSTISV